MYRDDEEEERGLVGEESPMPEGALNLSIDTGQDSNIAFASQKKPEQFSLDLETAKKANVNPALVEVDRDMAEQLARKNSLDQYFDQLYKDDNRVTATKTLADRNTTAAAQDEISTLGHLENWAKAVPDIPQEMASGASSAVGYGLSGWGAQLDSIQRKLIDEPLMAMGVPREFLFRDPDKQSDMEKLVMTITDIDGHLTNLGSMFKAGGESLKSDTENRTYLHDMTNALGLMVAQGFMAYANPAAGTGMMFGMGADMQNERMKEAGVESDPLTLATGGMITLASERIPLEKIMNMMPKGTGNHAVELFSNAIKAGGVEAVSEVAENLAHDTLEYISYNEGVEWLGGAVEEAQVAFGAGFTFNLLLNALAPKRGKARLGDYDGEQQRLDELIAIVQDSELKTRNPEILRMHLQNLGEEYGFEENVYIPAEEASELLQELSLDQSQPELASIYNQLPEALKIGADVVVPVEDFVKHFTDAEVIDKIRDHVRMSPVGLTRAEAAEVQEEDRQAIIDTMKQAIAAKEQKTEAQNVMDEIYNQLKDTGQVSSRGARLNARMMASFVATKAERSGMSVTEVFEAMNLRIQGEEHQGILPDSGLLLSQDFGDLEFEDEGRASGSGKNVKIKRKAQAVWNRSVKRRNQVEKLRDCING